MVAVEGDLGVGRFLEWMHDEVGGCSVVKVEGVLEVVEVVKVDGVVEVVEVEGSLGVVRVEGVLEGSMGDL